MKNSKLNKSLLNILLCPRCKKGLKNVDNKLICQQKHIYKIIQGVPVMARLDPYLQHEQKAWEDDWQNNISKEALKAYQKNMEIFTKLGYWEESAEAAKRIPSKEDSIVLDLGCGNGASTAYIKGKLVVGLDLSQCQLSRAKKRFKNKYYIVGDAQQLPLKDETFDLIVAINLLHHITDYRKVFQECFRVLKKGGMLLTVDPNLYNPIGFIGRGLYQQLRLKRIFPSFPQFALGVDEFQFTKSKYCQLFNDSPFDDFEIKPHRIERALFFGSILFPALVKFPFYEKLLIGMSNIGDKIVKIKPFDNLCYFWMGKAIKR